MSPDAEFVKTQNEVERIKLQQITEQLTSTQKKQLVDEALELKKAQDKEPNKSILPTLTIVDIPRKTLDPISLSPLSSKSNHTVFYNEQLSTNGIVHLSTLTRIPMHTIPEQYRDMIPIFASVC